MKLIKIGLESRNYSHQIWDKTLINNFHMKNKIKREFGILMNFFRGIFNYGEEEKSQNHVASTGSWKNNIGQLFYERPTFYL